MKPGGTTTCAKPGTGANECGAGITEGHATQLEPALLQLDRGHWSQDEQLASAAKQIGITINLSGKTFNYLIVEPLGRLEPQQRQHLGHGGLRWIQR